MQLLSLPSYLISHPAFPVILFSSALTLPSCSVPKIVISCLRGVGRFIAQIALLLQIVGTYGCDFVIKHPYGVSATEHNHRNVETPADNRCAAFGTAGIALSGADATYNFSMWMVSCVCIQGALAFVFAAAFRHLHLSRSYPSMSPQRKLTIILLFCLPRSLLHHITHVQSYLATTFGLAAVLSDCTILSTCSCRAARTRFVQNVVMASLQLLVCVMLGLKFTIVASAFCTAEWLDTDGVPLPNDSGDGSYNCTLNWGGVCAAVAVALWAAAGGMTLSKAYSEKAAEERKEQNQADAAARKTIARGSAEKEREADEAAGMEMVEGI